jgi:hypothetical protein
MVFLCEDQIGNEVTSSCPEGARLAEHWLSDHLADSSFDQQQDSSSVVRSRDKPSTAGCPVANWQHASPGFIFKATTSPPT